MIRPPGTVRIRHWLPGIAWGAAVYGFHKYGAISGWYLSFPWFQNLTHAASTSGVVVILFLVGLELGFRGRNLLSFVLGATAAAAVGWEVVEYLGWMDQYGIYLMFHGFDDAAIDMVSNAVGTAAALAVLWWWAGRSYREEMRAR